ncbi:MAG: hypothetical protein WD768_16115 [Phycisphaeraceae bacterium]
MNINWPATIAGNVLILSITSLILYLTRRQSAKAADWVDNTLVLRPSPTSRKTVFIGSIGVVLIMAGFTTVVWALEEFGTREKLVFSLVLILIVVAMLLWNWRTATLVVVISYEGVSVEYCGRSQAVLFEDLKEVKISVNDCMLIPKEGKKVQITAGIMGYDEGIAFIQARFREAHGEEEPKRRSRRR